MAAPLSKTNPNIVELAVAKMAIVDREFNELISSFGSLDQLKPADAYMFGMIRAAQNNCNYLSSFVNDLHKQISKQQSVKAKPVDPNLRPDED